MPVLAAAVFEGGWHGPSVKVLDRNLPHTRKRRIWLYVGDRDHPAVVYD
jgi:hypothetical protein